MDFDALLKATPADREIAARACTGVAFEAPPGTTLAPFKENVRAWIETGDSSTLDGAIAMLWPAVVMAIVHARKTLINELRAQLLPDPRERPAAFWDALRDDEAFDVLCAAPKVALWRKTKLGTVTFDGVRPQTQSIGGIDPPESVAIDAKGRGYRIPNTKTTATGR